MSTYSASGIENGDIYNQERYKREPGEYFIKKKISRNGERLPLFITPLPFQEKCGGVFVITWRAAADISPFVVNPVGYIGNVL